MSRSTFQRKAGLILALAALILGVTAATALGWANENNNNGKGHGKKETPPPTETTPATPPPQQVTTPPAPAPPPAAPAPAPVAPQGAPAQTPEEQVEAKGAPERKGGERQAPQNVPAEVTPAAETTLAPAVERKQLARTGLDPVLMMVLGAFCLAGGGLLFRRAMAR